ncbi:MAG: hypothetical protein ACU837_00560 [Gammaproteobacteria bacterium]
MRLLRVEGDPFLAASLRADLEAGADDKLGKPFHVEELLARIQASLKRLHGPMQPQMQMFGIQLDEERQAVSIRAAAHPALENCPALRQQLQEQIQAIHERIERELKRGRLSGGGQTAADFNPQIESAAACLTKCFSDSVGPNPPSCATAKTAAPPRRVRRSAAPAR